ncbi:hypothetical protein OO013_09225 [Mangrovivirga sp. M17]|uniref:Lipoprotein n=1 Tax=Mangrovivirga halotolerans TaxID=2993936 RepID=A0ABT3RR03_9BACT|nr:hypothetical protein [Mangrovivirga halotolerans]MCX2744045.1 hypothetical protein [Mangrovivirga halotolerans]
MKLIKFLFLLTLCGCAEEVVQLDLHDNVSVAVDLTVKNSQGLDLLDPANEESYKFEDMKLYYYDGNQKTEIYESKLTYPRNLMLFKTESEHQLRVFAGRVAKGTTSASYILEWNETEQDSIVCHYLNTESTLRVEKVWFEGKVVWDIYEDGGTRGFQIIK